MYNGKVRQEEEGTIRGRSKMGIDRRSNDGMKRWEI